MIFSMDKKNPSMPAIKAEGREVVSYGELCKIAENIGKAAAYRCLVFCFCRNEVGAVAGYLGFLSEGVVPLLLDASIAPEVMANLVSVYKPAYFWAPDDMADSLGEKVYRAEGYSLLKTGNEPYEMSEELCLLLATSGSTGSPKLVRQSRKNIEANAKSIVEYLGIDESERPITTLPMNYTYGLSIINSHLLAGACILMTKSSIVQRPFWEMFMNEGATSFGGVPYTYEILKKIRFFTMKLPSLKTMTQAGGKLPTSLQEEFGNWADEQGKRFVVMYGQTEATARMSYLPADKCLEKIGSMGIAIPGGKFWLKDTDGSIIEETDKAGELIYEGENVTLGYAECAEDLKKGDERFGVLETGDVAKRDADGYYYIVGRLKRFIKIFGIRVSLDEAEQLLKVKFPGTDFACVGTDDHMTIFADNADVLSDAEEYLAATLRQNYGAFKAVYIEKIPKNDSGKTIYKLLQEKI